MAMNANVRAWLTYDLGNVPFKGVDDVHGDRLSPLQAGARPVFYTMRMEHFDHENDPSALVDNNIQALESFVAEVTHLLLGRQTRSTAKQAYQLATAVALDVKTQRQTSFYAFGDQYLSQEVKW